MLGPVLPALVASDASQASIWLAALVLLIVAVAGLVQRCAVRLVTVRSWWKETDNRQMAFNALLTARTEAERLSATAALAHTQLPPDITATRFRRKKRIAPP